jgi:hypothetical protein
LIYFRDDPVLGVDPFAVPYQSRFIRCQLKFLRHFKMIGSKVVLLLTIY